MFKPSKIRLESLPPSLSDVDLSQRLASKKRYKKALKQLQKRMLTVQQAYYHQGLRAIISVEGWDASGKGGAIRRLTERLDPRGFSVYSIAAPTDFEQGKHYLYRFQTRLPAQGNIAIFDRSYYGRVLVERLEGFASEREWQRAYQEINEFERLLSDDGVRIIKIFLHIDKEEQLKRFVERLNNPKKRWKLTDEDIRNRDKWSEYEEAIDEMFARTSEVNRPWKLIAGNHKWHARVKFLKTVVEGLEKGVDVSVPAIDKNLVKLMSEELMKKN
ncbi:polyphosphate kinase 2 family protein [Marinomonas pollencensis]|uniref:Polyphosphate kinase 2 (PPK2 family) n=1 Tax=Marinomonas pollencensis TaxID=491954 RepID=A0A3E0DHB2_9GAMM|nr:polyphosphate kinase [Marinomonas pollencensis]REG81975.1 polyphosphate kinase 2 (PPK2 family) [Marinomonas pollencensis]